MFSIEPIEAYMSIINAKSFLPSHSFDRTNTVVTKDCSQGAVLAYYPTQIIKTIL